MANRNCAETGGGRPCVAAWNPFDESGLGSQSQVGMLFGSLFEHMERRRCGLFHERIMPALWKHRERLEGIYCHGNGRPAIDPVLRPKLPKNPSEKRRGQGNRDRLPEAAKSGDPNECRTIIAAGRGGHCYSKQEFLNACSEPAKTFGEDAEQQPQRTGECG